MERPVIKALMTPKYMRLIELQNEQLAITKEMFDEGLNDYYRKDTYYPPVAARLNWLNKLRLRIKIPMDDLLFLNNPVLETEEGLHMQSMYEQMIELIEDEEEYVFEGWAEEVPDECELHLNKSLLVRDEDMLLSLNFAPELVAILREVKYMNILEKEDIPQEAVDLFARVEELTKNIWNLNRTIQWYNWLRTKTKPVEYELIFDQMVEIDKAIDLLIETLNWNSDMWETINAIHESVKDLYDRVYQAQINLRKVLTTMDKWAIIPLYDRKDGKKDQLLYLDDRSERRHRRYKVIKDSALSIALMLDDNYRLYLKAEPPCDECEEEEEIEEVASPTPVASRKGKRDKDKKKGDEKPEEKADDDKKSKKGKKKGKKGKKAPKVVEEEENAVPEELEDTLVEERRIKWVSYLGYVDGLVGDMLLKAVMYSFGVYLSEMEPGRKAPLFEVAMELQEPYIRFVPSLNEDDEGCFYAIMKSILDDIVTMSEMIPRVAVHLDLLHYRCTIENNEDVQEIVKETLSKVQDGTTKAINYSQNFEKYSYLWLDNRQAFLKQFLLYGRVLTPEEAEIVMEDSAAIKETPPSINQFKAQIDYYEELYHTVSLRIISYLHKIYKIYTCIIFFAYLRCQKR